MPVRGMGGKVRQRSLVSAYDRTFPAGLVPEVRRAAAAHGYTVSVDDRRAASTTPSPCDLDWLADYQEGALLDWLRAGGQGIAHMATASGKTELAVAAATAVPCTWLWLTHRVSLLRELADRLERRTGEVAGVVSRDAWRPARVTVASMQTLQAALKAKDPRARKLLAHVEGLMVDECHILGSSSYFRLVMRCPAFYRLGLSATPFGRADKRGAMVVGAIGPVVTRVATGQLAAAGAIARGTVHMVELPIRPHRAKSTGPLKYHDAYDLHVVRSNARTDLTTAIARRCARPALAFVREEEHGRRLSLLLTEAGVEAEFTWGKKRVPEREAAVRRLEHADVDVLVCSAIFQEGVNIPSLAAVLHLAGGKAQIAPLQNAGRGARARDRTGAVVKTAFEVWDIADVHCGCRAVTPEGGVVYRHRTCKWFDEHARARFREYRDEGYEVVVHAAAEFIPV